MKKLVLLALSLPMLPLFNCTAILHRNLEVQAKMEAGNGIGPWQSKVAFVEAVKNKKRDRIELCLMSMATGFEFLD